MAKYSTTIDYNITTKLDASGITQLHQKLISIENEFNKLGTKQLMPQPRVNQALTSINSIRTALNRAFDYNTGMLNTQKFFSSLTAQGTNLSKITQSFANMGTTGNKAVTTIMSSVGRLDTQLKTMSTTSNKILTTFGNTFRWGAIASIFQRITNSVHEAVQYMYDLDKSLTDIQMVGHSSAEEMRELALQANEAAKALGSTTVAYTDATKIFVQQGLSLDQSQQFAEMSLKLANVAGESADEAAEQITALKNGFQMAGDSVESSLDKIVKTSHITASSVEELATASTRVAATANTLGVTDDQLYSQLSTIIQVTREAPEIVGNSLKTIYARFADLKLGETLEDGMDLGAFSGALEKLGVHVLDSNGQLREMGSIIEDLMNKWDGFDRATKQGAAVTLAGKFQYNRLMTLMENADAYRETLDKLQNDSDVEGLLNTKNTDVYLESLEGKANKLKSTFEGIISGLINQDDLGIIYDGITNILDVFDKFIDSVGGGIPILTLLGSTLTKTFSSQIAQGITNMFTNNLQKQIRELNAEAQAAELNILQNNIAQGNIKGLSTDNKNLINYMQQGANLYPNMSEQQVVKYNEQLELIQKTTVEAAEAQEIFDNKLQATNTVITSLIETSGRYADIVKLGFKKDGSLNVNLTADEFQAIKQQFEGLVPLFKEAAQAYEDFENSLKNVGKTKAVQSLGLLEDQVMKLWEQGVLAEKEVDELARAISVLSTTKDPQQFGAALKALREGMQGVVQTSAQMTNGIFESNEALAMGKVQLDQYKVASEQASTSGQKFIELLNKQVNIKGITETVSGIGQLAFAWQSFQHLGSLWTDDDISIGEKLLQTIINISFALPMLMQGLEAFKNLSITEKLMNNKMFVKVVDEEKAAQAIKLRTQAEEQKNAAIRKVASAERAEALANKNAQKGNMEAAAKNKKTAQTYREKAIAAERSAAIMLKEAAAAEFGAKSTTALGKAFSFLGGPIGVASIAIMGIIGVISAFIDQNNQAKEKALELAEEQKELAKTNLETIDSWNTLYEEYKNTGEVTSELVESSQNIVEQLELEGGQALITAGNYDILAKSIANAKDEQLKNQISAEQSTINAYDDSFFGKNFWDGSVYSDFLAASKAGAIGSISEQLFKSAFSGVDRDNASEVIGAINEYMKQLTSIIDELEQKVSTTTGDEKQKIQAKINELTEIRNNVNGVIQSEEFQGTDQAFKNIAEARTQMSDFTKKVESAKSAQSLLDIFANDSQLSKYWSKLNTQVEQYQFILSHISDEQQKLMVQTELSMHQLAESISKANPDISIDSLEGMVEQVRNSFKDEDFIAFVGQLDVPLTEENINEQILQFRAEQFDKIMFEAEIDTESLKTAVAELDNLQKIVDEYRENGPFDADTAAGIIAEHPEFVDYLVKVGDQYGLNENALEDWNDAVQRQRDELDKLIQVDFSNLTELDNNLENIADSLGIVDSNLNTINLGEISNGIIDLNNNFVNGQISLEEYLSGIANITGEIGSLGDVIGALSDVDLRESLGLDADELEDISSVLQELADSIQEVMSTMTRQFNKGDISLKQYLDGMREVGKAAVDSRGAISGLEKINGKWVASIDEATGAIDKQKEALADSLNMQQESLDIMERLSDTWQLFTERGEELAQIFGEFADIDPLSIDTEAIQTDLDNWSSLMDQFVTTSWDALQYAMQNNAEFRTDTIRSLQLAYETLGMEAQNAADLAGWVISQDEASLSNYLASGTAEAAATAGVLLKQSLGATQEATANCAQAIDGVLAAVNEAIASFEVNIDVNLTPNGEMQSAGKVMVGPFEVMDLQIPTGFHISTSNNSSGFKTSGAAITDALTGGGSNSYWTEAVNTAFGSDGAGFSDFYGNRGNGGGSNYTPSSSYSNPSGGYDGSGGGGGGGGKGGSGKGGSGSEEKQYEPKTKDYIEEEVDLYERIDTVLQAIENDYDRIADESDRLYGWERIDNINKQIDLLNRQIGLEQVKLKIQQEEAATLRSQLASQYGVTFDGEGFINNYAATHQALENQVNQLIAQYNAATTEEAQEQLEKQIEAAQKRLEDFKKQYQRYDQLVSGDIKDTIKTLEDLKDEIEDIQIEVFKTQLGASKNLKDLNEKMIEFNMVFSGLDKDDPFRGMETAAQKLAKYFDDSSESANEYYDNLIKRQREILNDPDSTDSMKKWSRTVIEQMEQARASMGDLSVEAFGTGYLDMQLLNLQMIMEQVKQYEETGTSSIFGENSAELYETAREVFNDAADMMINLEDGIDELRDQILSAIEKIGDAIDKRADQYQRITDELERQREIAELLYGDENYSKINEILDAQQKNYQSQIYEYQHRRIDDQGNYILDENNNYLEDGLIPQLKALLSTLKEGSKEWNEVNDQIIEAQEKLNDLVTSSLQNMREQYENSTRAMVDDWLKDVLGTDIEWYEEQWELINMNADYYLDDVNKAYNIQKLQSKYLDLLDNAGDLHTQQLITEQMEQQLGYLREKEKLSEYDVAYAEAQLEILQKQIALEEAQRNKSQLKLRRDSQGNYNYVYTADTEAVRGAQQDLLDAQNNAYNLSKDQFRQTQEDTLAALQKMKDLFLNTLLDASLTAEERKDRIEFIIAELGDYLESTGEQLSVSEVNMINDFLGMCESLTDENRGTLAAIQEEILNGNTDVFNKIDSRWGSSLANWLNSTDSFKDSIADLHKDIISSIDDYEKQVSDLAENVNADFTDITASVTKAKKATDDLVKSQHDFFEQLRQDSGAIAEHEAQMQTYIDQINELKGGMEEYRRLVGQLKDEIAEKDRQLAAASVSVNNKNNAGAYSQAEAPNAFNGSSKSSFGGGYSGGGSGGSGGPGGGVAEGIAGNIWIFGGWGNDPTRHSLMRQKFGDAQGDAMYNQVQSLFNSGYGYNYDPPNSWDYYRNYGPNSFDTGGYTGVWNNGVAEARNGKLAWLHSKELVLNEDDTRNILEVVNTVRDMVSNIKSGAISGMATGPFNPGQVINSNMENIEQIINVQASFPNANSVTEIQTALLGLADQSLQYAKKYR